MNKWELDWLIGCTTAAVIVLGITTAVYFGVQDTNQKYYATMDKCVTSGGTYVPQYGGGLCLMGVKQQ